MLKQFTTWATDKRWAIVVSVVAGLPALIKAINETAVDGALNWVSVAQVVVSWAGGFVIQRNVTSNDTFNKKVDQPAPE